MILPVTKAPQLWGHSISNPSITLGGYIIYQGVITYMSHVEVFETGIKIESSDQSPFGGADQGIKVTSGLLKIKNMRQQIDL